MTDQSQNIDIEQVECDAQDTVEAITKCINCIRNIDAFQPVMVKNALRNNSRNVQNGKEVEPQPVYLFKLLNKEFSKEQGLCKGLQLQEEGKEACRLSSPLCLCSFHSCSWGEHTIDSSNHHHHPVENDRHQVVYEIFLPLLERLGHLFNILDSQDGVQGKDDDDDDDDDETKTETLATSSQPKRKKKPNAPRGLLSLLNYTDIACILELTVCTSILPLLERHVQSSIMERSKHLPKSLAGRLHRKSLHWGMDTLQYKVDHRTMDTQPQQQQKGGGSEERISKNKILAEERAAMKIDRASKELSDVIVTVSKVLLLDRFRPMLLPRHATDIYSALFQLDRLVGIRKSFEFPVLDCFRLDQNELETNVIRRTFLPCNLGSTDTLKICEGVNDSMEHSVNIYPIDLRTMVNSYQTLLLSGKQAPSWLKSRLSDGLSNLAVSSSEGLEAIIEVFVIAAASLPTGQMTAASSRLGRALCAKVVAVASRDFKSSDGWAYYRALFNHFLTLLNNNDCKLSDVGMGSSNVALVLTIWAVLDNLPKEITRPLFFCRLVGALYPSPDSSDKPLESIQLSIRRIYSLLLLPPTGCRAVEELCLFLLSASGLDVCQDIGVDAPGSTSTLGQLIRIATSTRDKVLLSNITEEATQTINLLTYTTLQKWNHGDVSGEQYLAVSLLMSVATNPLDSLGYSFHHSFAKGDDRDLVVIEKDRNPPTNISLLSKCEERALFVVNQMAVGLDIEPKDPEGRKVLHRMQYLVGAIFRLQLLIYFESQTQKVKDSIRYLPTSIGSHIDDYKIISMLLLPALCEKCSPEALLMDREVGTNGVLHIISLIIISTSAIVGNGSDVEAADISPDLRPTHPSCDFSRCDSVGNFFEVKTHSKSKSELNPMVGLDMESQLSITSIVLSILVTVLELGSSRRIEREENDIKLLVPYLIRLSALGDLPAPSTDSAVSTTCTLKAEIADMSVHAAALIQARSLEDLPEEEIAEVSLFGYIKAKIAEVETQLASDQPPLRAHAIVQLRKLTQKALARGISETLHTPSKSLVIDISDGLTPAVDSTSRLLALVEDMLRVSVVSLEDTESYVYLASIQTIVAMVDENPSHFMPIIMNAVATGTLTLHLDNAVDFRENSDSGYNLTSTQRVKLIEAMNFIIRRRGSAIHNYASSMINTILYGSDSVGHSPTNDSIQKMIQVKTETYFRGDEPELVDENVEENSQYHQDMYLRLRTGGPVFNNEEEDVIRAACISILAELVSALPPSSVAPHCVTLVVLGTNALQLDHSRLVRRAAALLCRELYFCGLREAENEHGHEAHARGIPFILALLSSGEDVICAALRRSVAADDVDVTYDNEVKAVSGKSRLFDSATIARCEEALEARQELEASGLIKAGFIILKAQNRHERSSFARFLSREFKETDETLLSNKFKVSSGQQKYRHQ